MADTVYGVNLVANGSFEDIDYAGGHGHHHGHGYGHHYGYGRGRGNNAELSGWQTGSGPGPDIKSSDCWSQAADGRRYIELDGSGARNTNSSIHQDIATGGTGTFQLSFSYAAPPFSHSSSNGIEVIWNGQVIDTITSNGGWGTNWQTFTYELEGAGDMTRLEFRAVGRDDGRGGLLDDISVVGIEPPALFTEDADTVVLADDDPDYGSGEAYDALGGDDVVVGGDLADEIFGNIGNDTLSGGGGDDILTGGSESEVLVEKERIVEHDLSGLSETPTLGVDPAHFTLANDHQVTMTFVGEEAGYRNTVGIYKIADDGTIYDVEIVFQDASDSRWYGTETGTAVDLDLSGGDSFGVFIVADGASRNNFNRFDGGHYEFRNADGSPAGTDSDAPELVYVDSRGRARDVRGEVYHSAVSPANPQLNADDTLHVQSSSNGEGGLRLSFEDLPSRWSDNDFDDVVIDLSFAPVTETYTEVAADNDVLFGEDGDDTLFGGYGDDTLDGGTGNDILDGGDGNDILHGGDGNDTLEGGGGRDELFGDGGDDLIIGRGGRDTLDGGDGDDDLRGNGGNDTLKGGSGDDKLRGGNGDDELLGGAGDDLLIGGDGADTIDGGAGDDTVRLDFSEAGGEVASGGTGTDTLELTIETDDLADPAVLQAALDLMNFITNNADAGSDTGPSQAFAALGLEVSNFEAIDITVIDSATGEEIEGYFAPDVNLSVASASGDEDTAIALDISVSLGNAAGAFDISVTVSGVPAGATLSAGTDNNDGTWTLSEADLNGLTLTPAADSSDDFDLTVTATATSQISGAQTTSDPAQLDVTVDAVADAPTLSVADIVLADPNAGDQIIEGTDGKDTLQGFGGNDTINGGAKGDTIIGDGASTATTLTGALAITAALGDLDGSESLQIIVDGLPAGATLSAGTANGPGSVILTPAELSGLTITVPDTTDDFDLSVSAIATDTDPDSGQQSTASASVVSSAIVTVSVDGDDILNGGAGADTIQGNGGNDTIYGNGGADDIDGGDGDDVIKGGGGNDLIFGGAGNDDINGNNGNDIIFGGAGNDTLVGGGGDDQLDGGDGDDTLKGADENDTLIGGTGNDTLIGGGGDDHLDGGDGDDTLNGAVGTDTLIGGLGNDTLNGGGGDDHLDGGDGDDILTGGGQNDTLIGGLGNDILNGGGGTDSLSGGAGNDTLTGGSQTDTLDGGDGDDIINGEGGSDVIFGGNGRDVISGGAGADSIDGGADNDEINGDDGNDDIHGGANDDMIWGGLGKDELFGDDGNDILYGGEDNDTLHGGNDNDTLRGEAGNDLIFGDNGDDILIGGEGKDELHGGLGNDLLFGQEGGDTLFGDEGNDTLWGDGGADTLNGGTGNDRIEAHGGNDFVNGGTGVDFMIGGRGNDTFFFDLTAGDSGIGAGNRDIISDFDADAADTLSFGGISSFSFMGDETQSFAGAGVASGRFNDSLNVLEIDADGDQIVDLEIELQGVSGADLDDTDFTVS